MSDNWTKWHNLCFFPLLVYGPTCQFFSMKMPLTPFVFKLARSNHVFADEITWREERRWRLAVLPPFLALRLFPCRHITPSPPISDKRCRDHSTLEQPGELLSAWRRIAGHSMLTPTAAPATSVAQWRRGVIGGWWLGSHCRRWLFGLLTTCCLVVGLVGVATCLVEWSLLLVVAYLLHVIKTFANTTPKKIGMHITL